MADTSVDELVWHDDGHSLWLELNKHELVVLSVMCPGGDDCRDSKGRCVVEWFVNRFGLECHVGVAIPEEHMSVAWSLVGDADDKDESQVWVISVNDDVYAAWRSAQ